LSESLKESLNGNPCSARSIARHRVMWMTAAFEALASVADSRSESDDLRAVACMALARLGHAEAIPVLAGIASKGSRGMGLLKSASPSLRNAAIPVITVIGIGLADLLVGAPLTETVFAWPGLGRLLVASVGQRDLPVVMGAVLVFALVYVLANLLVDLAYAYLDPRLRIRY